MSPPTSTTHDNPTNISPPEKRSRDSTTRPSTAVSSTAGCPGRDDSTTKEATKKLGTLKTVLLVATTTMAMISNLATATGCSVIVPAIGDGLHVGEDELQWVISAYTLACGCLLIPLGRLADIYGSKKMFLAGTVWLAVFCIGCGFAQNIVTLNILRALAGVGGAAFMPACIGILASSFPPSRARSTAFAFFSAGAPVGGAVGTQLGAVLAEKTSITWRAPFFLFAGFAGLCTILGWITIDQETQRFEKDTRVDWIGSGLITSGLVLIMFALGQGSIAPQGWKTPYIIALLIVGVVLVVIFQLWQRYLEANPGPGLWTPPPLLKPSLWSRAQGKFAVMQMIGFFEWCGFISWFFWVQVYYQDYIGYSEIRTAVRLLPTTISGIICALSVGFLVGHVDLLAIVLMGTFMTGVAALLFANIIPSAPYWAFGFPSTTLGVFGADFVFTSGTIFVAKVSLPHEQNLAGGLFQTLTQLGSAFGLSITTIAHNSASSSSSLNKELLPYKAAQWTSFGFAMLCFTLALVFLRGVGPVGEGGKPKSIESDVEAKPAEVHAKADTEAAT